MSTTSSRTFVSTGGPTLITTGRRTEDPEDDHATQLQTEVEALRAENGDLKKLIEAERSVGKKPNWFLRKFGTPANGNTESSEPASIVGQAEEPKVKKQRVRKRFARHTQHVVDSYAAKMTKHEVFRGQAVRPAFTRWYHLLKPRLLVFYIIYGLNLLSRWLLGRWAPHWYAVPRPGLLERWLLARRTLRKTEFKDLKFFAVFSLKGGVGKTTITLLLAQLYRSVYKTFMMLVEDCNLDEGTLGARIKRTTNRSMKEAIRDVGAINSLSRLMRYCSHLASGLLIMVMGGWKLESADELRRLHDRFKQFLVGVVFCDLGTSTVSPSNIVAIEDAKQLAIMTTPGHDGIEQATKALLEFTTSDDGHKRELGRNAIIVINRWWLFWSLFSSPQRKRLAFLDAMAFNNGLTGRLIEHYSDLMGVKPRSQWRALLDQEHRFQERLAARAEKRALTMARKIMLRDRQSELTRVRFVVVGSSLWHALGLRVSHHFLGPRIRIQLQEINAMAAINMGDDVDLTDSSADEGPFDASETSSTELGVEDATIPDLPDPAHR